MPLPSTRFTLAGGPGIGITVVQTAEGTLRITATLQPGAVVGDLRGLYLHLAHENLVGGLAVSDASSPVTAFQQAVNGVSNLGAGISLSGAATPTDVGLAFGTASVAAADDLRSVSLTLSHASQALSLHDIDSMGFAAVLTSVGMATGPRMAVLKPVGRAGANTAPTAGDDSQHVLQGRVLHGSVDTLVSDAQNNLLGFSLVDTGLPGLSFRADGSYDYLPPDTTRGVVQFQYKANDGALDSNVGTVRITVDPAPENHPPVIGADLILGTEDAGPVMGNLSLNDSDPDGDTLRYAIVQGTGSGSLQLDPDGRFVYTPYANFNGMDFLLYVVDDGHGASSLHQAIFEVASVNDPPVARDVETIALEDIGQHGQLLAFDADDLPQELRYRVLDPAPAGLTWSSDGHFFWQFADDYIGRLSFRFEVSDPEGATSQGTYTLDIQPRPEPPVAIADVVETDYETTVVIRPLDNDTDEEGDPIRLYNLTPDGHPRHGTVTLDGGAGTITYTPEPGFFGIELLGYHAIDNTHSGLSNPGLITITVRPPPNVPPVATDDAYTFDNSNPTITISPSGLLANDSDRWDQTLRIVSYTQPDHGSVVVSADGGFSYTNEVGFVGSTGFSYTVSDGELSDEAFVRLDIVDSSPAQDDAYTTLPGQALQVDAPGLLANDLDLDTVTAHTEPAHGTLAVSADGSFVYTPDAGFVGTDSFSYTAAGVVIDDARVTITVTTPAPDASLATGPDVLLVGALDMAA